jgi:hypothetical protein
MLPLFYTLHRSLQDTLGLLILLQSSPLLGSGFNDGHSLSSGFPHCPRPQLPASHSNISQQLNPSSSKDHFSQTQHALDSHIPDAFCTTSCTSVWRQRFALTKTIIYLLIYAFSLDSRQTVRVRESESLYDWLFTANQFVLATSPLRITTRIIFN